jgi:hypothetical protein
MRRLSSLAVYVSLKLLVTEKRCHAWSICGFHIPMQEKVPILTCARKHFICELQLKEYIYNKC